MLSASLNKTFASYLSLEIGRKELVYLTTQTTHFIYGYMAADKRPLRERYKERKPTAAYSRVTLSDIYIPISTYSIRCVKELIV